MSDNDDASDAAPAADPEVSAAAPEVSKGWSAQDRRMLIITIGGTLAANLGTVILIGLAIALVHVSRRPGTPAWYLPLTVLVAFSGGLGMVIWNRIGARSGDPTDPMFLVISWLLLAFAVVVAAGWAAGVK